MEYFSTCYLSRKKCQMKRKEILFLAGRVFDKECTENEKGAPISTRFLHVSVYDPPLPLLLFRFFFSFFFCSFFFFCALPLCFLPPPASKPSELPCITSSSTARRVGRAAVLIFKKKNSFFVLSPSINTVIDMEFYFFFLQFRPCFIQSNVKKKN